MVELSELRQAVAELDVQARLGLAKVGGPLKLGHAARQVMPGDQALPERPVVLGLERVDPDREVGAALEVPDVGQDGEDGKHD